MRLLIIFLCLSLVGCGGVHARLTRLKDKQENTLSVPFKGSVEEAKAQIRLIGKEMKLIEPARVETEDFIELRTNLVKTSVMVGLFGSIAGSMAANPTKLGFFFNYDKDTNLTTITIAEEVSSIATASRHQFADKLKLKILELAKNEQ